MANEIETLVASTSIKSPVEKFYNFFKNNMNDIIKIFPAAGVQMLQGEDGEVGCVKQWNCTLGGVVPITAKVKTESMDDGAKSIKWTVLDGDVMKLYKNMKATLTVSEGLAKWTVDYQKTSPITPSLDLYLPIIVKLTASVDAYILVN